MKINQLISDDFFPSFAINCVQSTNNEAFLFLRIRLIQMIRDKLCLETTKLTHPTVDFGEQTQEICIVIFCQSPHILNLPLCATTLFINYKEMHLTDVSLSILNNQP